MDRNDNLNRPASATRPTWRQMLHDVNNVFTSIHSSLDLVLARVEDPEVRSFVERAQESVRRGARLVSDWRAGGEPAGCPSESPRPGAEPARPTGTNAAAAPVSLEGTERILLVDDDESVRLLMRAMLSYRGYQVVEARDGEEGVECFRRQGPFALVILDLQMPRLDGKAALEEMRKIDPRVRALSLSGELLEKNPTQAADGFDGCLSKPFESAGLLGLVRQLLDRAPAA